MQINYRIPDDVLDLDFDDWNEEDSDEDASDAYPDYEIGDSEFSVEMQIIRIPDDVLDLDFDDWKEEDTDEDASDAYPDYEIGDSEFFGSDELMSDDDENAKSNETAAPAPQQNRQKTMLMTALELMVATSRTLPGLVFSIWIKNEEEDA